MNSTFLQRVKNEAQKELDKENTKKYQTKYLTKLKQINNTEVILKNLKRELEELEYEIDQLT